jgi:hypothetical protein
VTPVVNGKPVAFVSVALDGVPNTGVTRVGLVANTLAPEPVEVVTPVPPLTTGNAVPEYPIANVPLVVTGLPVIDKNDGTVAATDVTVPEPPLIVAQDELVPSVVRYLPELVA